MLRTRRRLCVSRSCPIPQMACNCVENGAFSSRLVLVKCGVVMSGRKTTAASYAGAEAHELQFRSVSCLSENDGKNLQASGMSVAFDPVQIRWVQQDIYDDFQFDQAPLSWTGGAVSGKYARYVFRRWRPEDAPTLARLLSLRSIWRFMPEPYPGPVDPNAALELIALSNESRHHFVRAIEWNGRVIGQVRLAYGDRPDRAEVSYWFDDSVWGQGHGGKAVSRFVSEVIEINPGINDLIARVHIENPASARVLEKAGFTEDIGVAGTKWRIFRRSMHQAQALGA